MRHLFEFCFGRSFLRETFSGVLGGQNCVCIMEVIMPTMTHYSMWWMWWSHTHLRRQLWWIRLSGVCFDILTCCFTHGFITGCEVSCYTGRISCKRGLNSGISSPRTAIKAATFAKYACVLSVPFIAGMHPFMHTQKPHCGRFGKKCRSNHIVVA